MKISKDKLNRIAELASLKINDNEIDEYISNLEDILEYTKVIDNLDLESMDETFGSNINTNVFRKDEVIEFDNNEGLLSNSKNIENNMFKVPDVL